MRHQKSILLAAVLAAVPAASSQGAIVTYQYYNVLFGTAPGTVASAAGVIPGTAVTGTGAAEVITLPVGDYVSFGIQGEVTNNAGGLYSWNLGLNNSNGAAAQVYAATKTASAPLVAPAGVTVSAKVYTLSHYGGNYDGAGGIQATSSGAAAGTVNISGQISQALAGNGLNAFAPLFSKLPVFGAAGGTSTFTPVQINGGTGLLGTAPHASKTTTTASIYNGRSFGAGDTLGALPTLTITVTGGVTTTTTSTSTTATAHPIVSLLNTAPPSYYGNQIGSPISITGHNGSYTIGNTGANNSTGVTAGFTLTSVFNPLSDKEVYALKLLDGGVAPTAIQLAAAINDINNGGGAAGTAGVNVSASAITGVFATLFPASAGWDVLLTSTGTFGGAATGGSAWLGLDFSQDTNTPGLTVTEIAAVPEPATMAGAVLGAAGLLLGRRKSKATAA